MFDRKNKVFSVHDIEIVGYCSSSASSQAGALWPTPISVSIYDTLFATCNNGYLASSSGAPRTTCSTGGTSAGSGIWTNYLGSCEGLLSNFNYFPFLADDLLLIIHFTQIVWAIVIIFAMWVNLFPRTDLFLFCFLFNPFQVRMNIYLYIYFQLANKNF